MSKKKLEKFNMLCGDWDFRNIDMTEPHLQSININGNNINTICELFSTESDDYIFCDSGTFNDIRLVKKFEELNLNNREEVLYFISDIEKLINWDNVNQDLRKQGREVKILGTWVTDYDDLDCEAILIENKQEVARIIDGYDESSIRYNFGNSDTNLTDEFCKKSLESLILDDFENLKNRPKLSKTSKLLQMLVDEVITSNISMCYVEYDIWKDYIDDGTFKESDIDELKKEIDKYKLDDVIEFDCNEAKITGYGNLQYIFNDDRNLNNNINKNITDIGIELS